MMRRRWVVEGLEDRMLMAYDIQAPVELVAEFPTQFNLVNDAPAGIEISSVLGDWGQERLSTIYQSEAAGGKLYTAGVNGSGPAYIETDLATPLSKLVNLPSFYPGRSEGAVWDIETSSSMVQFGGDNLNKNLGEGARSAFVWDILGNISLVSPPNGAGQIGSIRAMAANGFVGGTNDSTGAFVKTNNGSFVLPKDQTTLDSVVLSISDSGIFIGGAIGFDSVVWKAQGNPEDGNYELLNLSWQLPQDAQGIDPMYIVMENAAFGGLGMTSYLDENGDSHAGIWSLSDGSLIKDLGPTSEIQDAKTIGSQIFVAYNDSNGAHVLNFETNQIYDLNTLLGSTASRSLTAGSIFTTQVNGKDAIGLSYMEGASLKASAFELITKSVDLEWDFNADGITDLTETSVSLPHSASHSFASLRPSTVRVVISDKDGSRTTIEKSVNVGNVALVVANNTKTLYIGGDATNDVVSLEKLESGALKVTVNGTTQEFAVVDEIFADLGDGENRLAASGPMDLNSDQLAQLSFVTLSDGATLSNFTEAAAVQMGATSGGPLLTLTTPPKTGASPLAFSNEWIYTELQTVSGIPQHRIVGATGVQILIKNDNYQNPLNNIDTNGNGRITPTDALLIINYLNERSGGNTPPILWNINVNGDTRISPSDALAVINYLNSRPSGEGESLVSSLDSASTTSLNHDSGWMFDWLDSDDQMRRGRKR